ncbi:SAM-dependent DNA methyltransferase [Desertifilum sp. FACHB-1129]|uniref:N-6 DNA methylase n=1 Tax=unclassified Desertifilum TaxID=2621682 RepID=UPI0016820D0D|nr:MULTISPECIES: N-6 DNA methylase [unclassified Desertifilum]MBD2311252.1 SAM-dependent DNA methyltransferase [Desertifilum sp. FACHB-1129]MBD2324302.1 SAM-dependent DNA methyltransferase [Desertifilum sp. FACHB-866]MBD2334317.1 SAM-dependent DNA methyltransferase [Desertifilum sp. FACHB-868]MDA0213163.1 N-6 DNA methylase [Cyanobacteria bacterium FC1]
MSNPDNFHCSEWLSLFEQCLEPGTTSTTVLPTIAIANPPYGKTHPGWIPFEPFNLGYHFQKENEQWVRTNRTRTTVAIDALFAELCVNQLAPGEVMVLLVPNSLLANNDTLYARQWLLENNQLVASIQLPPTLWKVECKIAIATSILVLQRQVQPEDTDYSIFMALIENVGFDRRGKPTFDNDFPSVLDEFCTFLTQLKASHY